MASLGPNHLDEKTLRAYLLMRPCERLFAGTKNLLSHSPDVWELIERAFIVALDRHDLTSAEVCLASLRKQFPKSVRVRRLEGMLAEARGRFDEALEIYNSILEKDDPTNVTVWKRKAAVLRGRGAWSEATTVLSDYLKHFPADEAAWQELAELYVASNKLDLAAFCMEELITLAPENYLYHLQYAELLYTRGARGDVEMARQYFAQAVELKQDCLRALYGLIMCLKKSIKGAPASLHSWTVDRILELHNRSRTPADVVSLVERCIS